jgi:salicylate hydroxylase
MKRPELGLPPSKPRRIGTEEAKPDFRGWEVIEDLVNSATECVHWTLLDLDMPEKWIKDKSMLVGDAAHPMLPFL